MLQIAFLQDAHNFRIFCFNVDCILFFNVIYIKVSLNLLVTMDSCRAEWSLEIRK